MPPRANIKAIIFDWMRTLFDSEIKQEFAESEGVLQECQKRGYTLAVASLVSQYSNANLEERRKQIEQSPLRKFFKFALVTDTNKDIILAQLVSDLSLPPQEVLIVDDRTVRGIAYGNSHGHPTVWLQQGKFANELPNEITNQPSFTIHTLNELLDIV